MLLTPCSPETYFFTFYFFIFRSIQKNIKPPFFFKLLTTTTKKFQLDFDGSFVKPFGQKDDPSSGRVPDSDDEDEGPEELILPILGRDDDDDDNYRDGDENEHGDPEAKAAAQAEFLAGLEREFFKAVSAMQEGQHGSARTAQNPTSRAFAAYLPQEPKLNINKGLQGLDLDALLESVAPGSGSATVYPEEDESPEQGAARSGADHNKVLEGKISADSGRNLGARGDAQGHRGGGGDGRRGDRPSQAIATQNEDGAAEHHESRTEHKTAKPESKHGRPGNEPQQQRQQQHQQQQKQHLKREQEQGGKGKGSVGQGAPERDAAGEHTDDARARRIRQAMEAVDDDDGIHL